MTNKQQFVHYMNIKDQRGDLHAYLVGLENSH